MSRKWLAWFTALILLIPVVAVAAPPVGEVLQAWMDQTDQRIAELEARVAVLEAATTTTSTLATSSTTTTVPTATTVSPSTTTTTIPPVTSTTVPPSTTTAPTTTTTAVPTTTVPPSTTPPSSSELTSDLLITEDTTLTGHIEGNGHQILIDGADVTMSDLTVNNVSRIMWHGACGVATLDGVEVLNSGRVELGFYPLHFHLCGDATRGSVIENTTVSNSAFRAFVPHGSHGITIRNSRCENIAGECVWWDFPGTNDADGCGGGSVCDFIDNSNDTTVDGVVCDGVVPPEGFRGFRQSCFMLGAGTGNAIRNSSALNVEGRTGCSGFHWPEFGDGHGRGQPLTWVFENNTAHNPDPDCHGIFVWQNDDQDHIVSGFTGDGVGHGAYVNDYHYEGLDVPYVEAHAAGWSISDSHIEVFTAERHRNLSSPTVDFSNVTFGRFIVDNASNGGDVRGIYRIAGTNLTCGDIEYQSVVPGTEVWIDGQEC